MNINVCRFTLFIGQIWCGILCTQQKTQLGIVIVTSILYYKTKNLCTNNYVADKFWNIQIKNIAAIFPVSIKNGLKNRKRYDKLFSKII